MVYEMAGARALDAVSTDAVVDDHGQGGAHDWTPPATRDEADDAILALSTDVGLILAQLAEDQSAWCDRTGRTPAEYQAWRRRALFAKVHKEAQLRECKRIRGQLSGGVVELAGLRAGGDAAGELVARCREAVEAWLDEGAESGSHRLDLALARVAALVDRLGAAAEVSRAGRPWAAV